MQPAVHVGEGKSDQELLIRTLPRSFGGILLVNFFPFPLLLHILLNLLKVLDLEGTLAIEVPCL